MKVMLIVISIFISTQCYALGEVWVNKTVTAVGDVNLRSSPPQGLFCSKGKSLAIVKRNEKVKVIEHIKVTCSILFSYDFLKVERTDPGIPQDKRFGNGGPSGLHASPRRGAYPALRGSRAFSLGDRLENEPGMGLRFLEVTEAVRAKLRNYVQWVMMADLEWEPEFLTA
jgi:hypothetical protein